MNSLFSCGRGSMALCLLLVVGCGQEKEIQPEYRVILSVSELMAQVLDPATDVIWDSAGFIITDEGEENLAPTTDAGWTRAANNAAVVMETANLLMLPGRARSSDWMEIAAGLADAGLVAKTAAERHDADALFDAGGSIYRVCVSCHQLYWVQKE